MRRFLASQSPLVQGMRARYRISVEGDGTFEESRLVEARGIAAELYRPAFRVLPELLPGRHHRHLSVRRVPEAPLFSEADVVRLMRERGIGRPSTYAVILSKLKQRGYVIERSNRLIATKLGREVHAYLTDRYGQYVSEERTRQLEARMEAVEQGRADPAAVLRALARELRAIDAGGEG